MIVLIEVLTFETYYYCSLVDYAIDTSTSWDLNVIAYVVSLWSCWKSEYELDIITTTRSNRVRKSFSFVSFSLSTELLEDKQRFKLGGVDTSPTYLLFQTLLPLFWTLTCMIWMKLTRTNAVFSRTPWCHFMCQKEKFLECPGNPRRHFLEFIRIFGERINARGAQSVHEIGDRALGGAPPCLVDSLWAPWH